jgi:hypothetical protein
MEKKIFASLVVAIGIIICFNSAYAIDIDGWWVVRSNVLQGDFVTGEWISFLGYGKKVSYMYISNAKEDAYGGPAWFYIWNDLDQEYIEEIYPLIYIKNNVIVLFGPTGGPDVDGNFWGYTIVLRPYGAIGRPNSMKGFYTLYDMEDEGTPDQFVRMGTIDMSRVQPKYVPKEVKDDQITP